MAWLVVPLLVSRVVRTHLSKVKCTTKAEFFIVLHNHDCRGNITITIMTNTLIYHLTPSAHAYVLGIITCTHPIFTYLLSYEEHSVKKSPTGEKGIVQCSFKNGLPGRGECM